ncbi:MAG: hypothetical protein ACKUBY_02490 [Candidatus Moraniibacteriota bacterium]|jgi:hypothetical protein
MQDYKDQKKYYPTLVSDIQGVSDKNGFERIQKIKALPQKTQDILFSDKIIDVIYDIERRYYLSDENTEGISRSIRQYFLREITQEGFIEKLSISCNISNADAIKLLHVINSVSVKVEQKEKKQIKKINLDKNKFSVILKKYPKILEQKITNNKITNPKTGEQVQPTLKNWIRMYEIEFGASGRTMMNRGDFMFQSSVTRGLNDNEKQVVSQLLKSKDENSEVSVDIDKSEIVFENIVLKSDSDINKTLRQTPKSIPTQQINKSVIMKQIQNSVPMQQTRKAVFAQKNNKNTDLNTDLNQKNINNEFTKVNNTNSKHNFDNIRQQNSDIGQVDELKNKLANSQKQLEKLETEIIGGENNSQYEQQMNRRQKNYQKPPLNPLLKKEGRQVASQELSSMEQITSQKIVPMRQTSFQKEPQSDIEKEILKNRAEMNNEVIVNEFQKVDDGHVGIQSNLITSKKVQNTKKKNNINLIKTNKKQKPNKYIKQDAINKVEKVENSINNVSGNITFSSKHRMPGES